MEEKERITAEETEQIDLEEMEKISALYDTEGNAMHYCRICRELMVFQKKEKKGYLYQCPQCGHSEIFDK